MPLFCRKGIATKFNLIKEVKRVNLKGSVDNRKAMARSNTATSDSGSVIPLVAGGDAPGLLRRPRARVSRRRPGPLAPATYVATTYNITNVMDFDIRTL